MDRNSQKWSQKCYHSLPFAAKVSVRRSFEQFHNLNKRQGSFQHHSIPPCNLYKWKFFWARVETQLLKALFFLPFGTPDSGSKFRRYQVFMSYHWASAGMTKGNRLSKRKRNVLRRDDYFYFHHYSFQICITDQASGQYDWISIWLVSFLKVLQRFIESQRQKVTSKCAIVLLYWLYVIVAGRGLCSLHFASRRFQNHSLLRQL